MNVRRMVLAAAGALTGLVVAMGFVLAQTRQDAPHPGAAFLLPAPLPAPDFELVAHTGEPVRLAELGRDRVLVLFFGYTHCPDVCPLTMANLGRALELLGDDAGGVRVALVTVDPARDDAARLGGYVDGFPGDILGLTGPVATLREAARGYLVYAERPTAAGHDHAAPAPAGDDYLIDHTGRTLVIRDGRVLLTFPPETPPRGLAAGLELALRR